MLEGEVENLWSAAKANPRVALAEANTIIDAGCDGETLAWANAAAGRAYFELGANEVAIEAFERALSLALDSSDRASSALHDRVTISLGAALAASGRSDEAFGRLEEVAQSADPAMVALAQSQLGLLELHAGRPVVALERLEPAVETLAGLPTERQAYARALANAGYAELVTGRLDSAISRFTLARESAETTGQMTVVAGCAQNIGYARMRQGNLPAALSELERARELYRQSDDPGRNLSTLLDDLAETYRIAGLTIDAVNAARDAQRLVAAGGNLEKQADATYRLARCQLDAQDEASTETAACAAEQFAEADRASWVQRSELLRIEALAELRHASADELFQALEDTVPDEAPAADLEEFSVRNLIALEQLRAGRLSQARSALATPGVPGSEQLGHDQSLMAKIERQLASSILAVLDGQPLAPHADEAALLIRSHTVRLADPEMRAGAARLMNRLRRLFVGDAIDRGDGAAAFACEERFRSISLAFARATPLPDEETASISQELRDLTRDLESSGDADESQRRRMRELEGELRRRSMQSRQRQGIAAPTITDIATFRDAAPNRQVIEWIELDQELYVLTPGPEMVHLGTCGSLESIRARARQIRTDLARLARPGLSPSAAEQRWATLLNDCCELSELLLPPAEFLTTSHDGWLLSPPRILADLPWSLLLGSPGDGRPASVVPSMSWWLRSQEHEPAQLNFASIVGPGLEHARSEAAELTSLFDAPEPATTIDSALSVLQHSSLLHVASHGMFRAESPRFSNLRLDDGPLALYEIDRTSNVPSAVVLAACDTGRHTSTAGGELLGFVPTWLAAGSTSVVAPICAVGDKATSAFVECFYAQLRQPNTGIATATAKAQAKLDDQDSQVRAAAHSFIHVGCDIAFVSNTTSGTLEQHGHQTTVANTDTLSP